MSPESICNFRENIFLEKRESYGALMVTSIVRSRFKSHRLHQESPPIRLILGFWSRKKWGTDKPKKIRRLRIYRNLEILL
jgi:hypothetical protein